MYFVLIHIISTYTVDVEKKYLCLEIKIKSDKFKLRKNNTLNNKEAIIKQLALFILLGATSLWAYTDTGEPYVAVIACIIQILFFRYELGKQEKEQEKQEKKEKQVVKKSTVVGDISNNRGTIHIGIDGIGTNKVTVEKEKIKKFYHQFFLASSLFDYEYLKKQIEYDYLHNKDHIYSLDPQLRVLYENLLQVIERLTKQDAIIIIIGLIELLCAFVFVFIEEKRKRKITLKINRTVC